MRFFYLFFIFFLIKSYCFSQKEIKFYDFSLNKNDSFDNNEVLYYKFTYGKSNNKGFLTGGYGSLEVGGLIQKDSIVAYKIEAKGRTTKIFSLFFNVKDFFSSYMDKNTFQTHQFIRSIKEGGYEKNQSANFDRKINVVDTDKNRLKINKYTHDVLSALYACRTIPNNQITINDTIYIQIFNLEKEKLFNTYIVPVKKEKIKTKCFNEVSSIKCHVHVEKNRIFSDKDATYIWVTDDEYHIPIKVETPIQVGSIYIEIIRAENINESFYIK